MNGYERTVPLPGPIESLPLSAATDRRARGMLRQALSGVALGGFDREALDYLADRDTRVTVAVASLLRRSWQQGVLDGKAERLDAAGEVAQARLDKRTLALTVLAAAERADAALDDEHPDRQGVAEQLVASVRMAVVAALGQDGGSEATRLQRLGGDYRAQYARAVGDDHSPGHRNMAVAAVVESAVTLTTTDAELAAAVRAVVAADQAEDAAAQAALRALHPADRPDAQAPAGRDRFTVFAGPDGWAWAEGWTGDGHSVLATGCRWIADAVQALRQANPGAVITTAAPAEGADVLTLAAAGGHFAVDADPACTQCTRLARPVVDGQDHNGRDPVGDEEVVWVGRPGDYDPNGDEAREARGGDAGSVANGLVLAVLLVGVLASLVFVGASWPLWLVPVVAVGGAGWLLARMHGICRACGHHGSAGDPLTVMRRPRVHTRHVANIRASRRNSRLAARAARDDAAGGVR